MGCDIHMYIEHRPRVGFNRNDGIIRALQRRLAGDPGDREAQLLLWSYELYSETWEPACFRFYPPDPEDPPETQAGKNEQKEFWDLMTAHPDRIFAKEGRSCRWYSVLPDGHLYFADDRDYTMFGVLTGTVRGGSEQAITKSPRGFPKDASDLVRLIHRGWSSDAHSASRLTGREVIEWPGWKVETQHEGYVPLHALVLWRKQDFVGSPFSAYMLDEWKHQQEIEGPDFFTRRSVAEMSERDQATKTGLRRGLAKLLKENKGKEPRTYVRLKWSSALPEETDGAYHKMFKFWTTRLNPDQVRFTFYFDN